MMTEESEIALRLHNARLAVKEIHAGNASGCLPSLYGRATIERVFESLGKLITVWSPILAAVLFGTVVLVFAIFCIGFMDGELETEVADLWIETGGRLDNEIDYTEQHVDEDTIATSELIIQLVKNDNFTASLYDHLHVMRAAVEFSFLYKNRTINFRDVCAAGRYFTGVPELDRLVREALPCVFITPLDCYWEGSLMQLPDNYVAPFSVTACIVDNPIIGDQSGGITWGNLDFDTLRSCLLANLTTSFFTPYIDLSWEAAEVTGYAEKDCFSNNPDCPNEPLVSSPEKLLINGCSGFSELVNQPRSLIVDGNPGEIPQALRSVIVLEGPATLQENFLIYQNINYSLSEVEEILTIWKSTFFNLVINFNGGQDVLTDARKGEMSSKLTNDEVYGWTSDTVENLSEEYSGVLPVLIIVGYCLMVLYCAITFLNFNWIHSHVSVGLVGLLLVALASGAALGLTAWCGVGFNITTTQIFPFLVLGIGVDDMFVIGDAFFEIEHHMGRDVGIKTLLSTTLRVVGPSVTLTSITNAAGFFLSAVIPIPAIRNFAIQVGLAVVFNYLALLIGLSSYLVLDYYRVQAKMVDLICCIPGSICCCCNEDKDTAKIQDTKPAKKAKEDEANIFSNLMTRFKQYKSPMTALVVDFYSPFLQNYVVKIFVIVICSIWFGFTVWGCTLVEDGLDLDDALPSGTVEHSFATANVRHFAAYSFTVVTKDIDYTDPKIQAALLQMDQEISRVRYVEVNEDLATYWLELVIAYYVSIDDFYKTQYCARLEQISLLPLNEQQAAFQDVGARYGDFIFVYSYIHAYIDRLNLNNRSRLLDWISQCDQQLPPLFEFDNETNVTYIPSDKFYQTIAVWPLVDDIQFQLAAASFSPREVMGNLVADEARLYEEIDNYGPIEYAGHIFLCEGLSETSDFENLINEVRGILEKYERFGIYSYPSGAPFLFWEQYINLRRNVGLACGLILVACFIATLFFLMDLWSAVLLVCMLALISAEVFGITGFLDIKFSSIPAIIIIASVGVAVEFTAPLTFYFLKASPEPGEKELSFFGLYDLPNCVARWFVTRNERMHKALEHRFTPVFNGSVTTFLGIVMLAFAPLPFVRLYFFAILLSVVLLGMLNGLVLLPVVLSLVGPPAQAYPKEKKGDTNGIPLDAKNPGFGQKQSAVLY